MKRLLLVLPLLATGCAKATEPAALRYEGHYSWGFEVNGFQPCGSSESWWVTEGDLHARYRQVAGRDYEPVYVVLRGEAGPPGKFGHLGAYARELAVREVVEMRAARDGDCR